MVANPGGRGETQSSRPLRGNVTEPTLYAIQGVASPCSNDEATADLANSVSHRAIRIANWQDDRWTWKRAVRRDGRLSDGAKVLAAALCDDFAHRETGFCNPAVATLAAAVGKKVRAVQYALAELRDRQWLEVGPAMGRGNTSEIHFLTGDGSVPFQVSVKVTRLSDHGAKRVQEPAPAPAERVQVVVQKGASYGAPYKDKPKKNQKTRAREPERDPAERPTHLAAVVLRGGHGEARWNEWLAAFRFPSLQQLNRKSSNERGVGWDMPFSIPPRPEDDCQGRISHRFVNWAVSQMEAGR